jgi:hypothetical protein
VIASKEEDILWKFDLLGKQKDEATMSGTDYLHGNLQLKHHRLLNEDICKH